MDKRNVDRALKRLSLKQARLRVGADVGIRDEERNIAHAPADDELVPQVSGETLAKHSLFPILDPTWNVKKRGGKVEWSCPNPNTPKRDGEPLDGPDPQRVRPGEAAESEMGDRAFTERHMVGLPRADVVVTVAREHLRRTGDEPTRGGPAYEIMYPMRNPLDVTRGPIFVTKNYRDLSPEHGWVTGAPLEPLTTALNLAGAQRVDAQKFRTLNGNFAMGRP